MARKVELEVTCPDCGWVQKYHSHNKPSELSGKRRATCNRCGRSFKVLEQRVEKVKNHRRKKSDSDRPFDWHKFSKSGEANGEKN